MEAPRGTRTAERRPLPPGVRTWALPPEGGTPTAEEHAGPRWTGRGVAVASLVVSALSITTVAVALLALPAARDRYVDLVVDAPVDATVPVGSLGTGDCFDATWVRSATSLDVREVTAVDCGTAHDAEVYATFDLLGAGAYPGEDAVVADADAGCDQRFGEVVGRPSDGSGLEVAFLHPTPLTWDDGDRQVSCLVYDPVADTVGTLVGAGRR